MITADANVIIHDNCTAVMTLGVLLSVATWSADTRAIANAIQRAHDNGTSRIGRAVVTHTGYRPTARHHLASAGLYRITIGRIT
jgi:hypothetical protein